MDTQRERLLEGMVWAAARHGYAGASVAEVIGRAGVSRATFYEHFRNREECFLEAYRGSIHRLRAALSEAAKSGSPSRPRALLEASLREFSSDRAAARVLLVEALAAGRRTLTEHQRSIGEAEVAIGNHLDRARGSHSLQVPASALLGGLAGTVSMHVFAGDGKVLPRLTDDLAAWLSGYELCDEESPCPQAHWESLGQLLPPPPPTETADGASPAPANRGAVRHRRILIATARVVAQRGYANTTVSDIVAAAGTSRRSFYSHFAGKRDAFLAALALGLEESIGAAASEFFAEQSWPARVWNAGSALLTYMARSPELAWLGVVEAHAAGEAAIQRQHDARNAYTIFLEEGYRMSERPLPRIASDAIAWAVFSLIRGQLMRGRAEEMLAILPAMAYTILAPFTGPAAALEFVEARSRSARLEPPRER